MSDSVLPVAFVAACVAFNFLVGALLRLDPPLDLLAVPLFLLLGFWMARGLPNRATTGNRARDLAIGLLVGGVASWLYLNEDYLGGPDAAFGTLWILMPVYLGAAVGLERWWDSRRRGR